jgi:hypothetical protein
MLEAKDEFAHAPVETTNWQENYVWHAWSPQSRCGWNIHLGNLHEQGVVDVRAHVIINGEVTAGNYQASATECFDVEGIDVDIMAPFERLRIRFSGRGSRGADAGGWFGTGPADVPFSLDIEVTTPHQPFDSSKYPELEGMMDLPGTGNHYELGGTWHGSLRSGHTSVEVSGYLVRDHSWGGRVWNFDDLFWVPMVFPAERQFIFNLTERHGEKWSSLSVTMGENGVVSEARDIWVRLAGERRPRQFASAEVLMRGDDATELAVLSGEIHLPIGRALSRHGLSDMYSHVECAGRVGFTTVQLFPSEEDVLTGFQQPLSQFRA